jgi:hypothetical protein
MKVYLKATWVGTLIVFAVEFALILVDIFLPILPFFTRNPNFQDVAGRLFLAIIIAVAVGWSLGIELMQDGLIALKIKGKRINYVSD